MTTHDLDEVRAGRREANLRLLNERIATANERFQQADGDPDVLRLMCECAHQDCTSTFDIPADLFETVRTHAPARFIVVEGHEVGDVEDVVERGSGWVLVQKHGDAARAARRVLE